LVQKTAENAIGIQVPQHGRIQKHVNRHGGNVAR
jgi:hypothetical protein